MYILAHDFEMVHVPGDKHKVPDALSCRSPQEGDQSDHSDLEAEADLRAEVVTLITKWPRERTEEGEIRLVPKHAPVYEGEWLDYVKFLTEGKMPEEINRSREMSRFIHIAVHFTMKGRRLYRLSEKAGMPREVVLEEDRRTAILNSLHEDHGHKGRTATLYKIRARF